MRRKPKGDSPMSSFLRWFMPKQARAISSSSQSFVHYELAKYFLRQCTIYHLHEMWYHLDNYIGYFSGAYDNNSLVLYQVVNQMCSIAIRAKYLIEVVVIKENMEKCARNVRDEGMRAIVRQDVDSVEIFWRYEALAEAPMGCGTTVLALKSKCVEAELNYDEYFGASADPERFPMWNMQLSGWKSTVVMPFLLLGF